MKLKEIEIFGFKSFADKITLKIGEGTTIIVGPNGAGKSNIVDAIRWVLGEQSAKSLRGSKMEDVIFMGSSKRKPLSMAEVSLILDNEDKSINLDYNEIKVTRRLYRSGESEYLINDNPVRLKDIHELFMDTGAGIDYYSIISQGEVEKIINAKPVERREIFEEAAGITKYIKKRDESLRRLEDTEQNMLRINDILDEVKRQVRSLENQAKKAEKYKVLKQNLHEMEVKILKKDLKDKINILEKYNKEKEKIEEKLKEKENKLKEIEINYENQRNLSVEKEKKINEKNKEIMLIQNEIDKFNEGLKFLNTQKQEFLNRIKNLKDENAENIGKIEQLKLEIQQIDEKLKVKEKELFEKKKRIEDFSNDFESIKEQYDKKNIELNNLNNFLKKKKEEKNRLSNEIVEVELNLKNINTQNDKLFEARILLEEKLGLIDSEIQNLKTQHELNEEEVKEIKEKEEVLIKQKLRLKIDLERLDNIIKELDLSIRRLKTRHDFLTLMHEKLEGYKETVKKVLTEYKEQLGEDKNIIVDVVGNLISTNPAYEHAVEKVLEDKLQTILIKNDEFIKEIFEMYEYDDEISFLVEDKANVDSILSKWKNLIKHKNILFYLPDIINSQYYPIKILFYNIFIVENLEKGKIVLDETKIDHEYFLLTLKGELLSNYGIYKKGRGKREVGFLTREREILEIKNEILLSEEKLKSIKEERLFLNNKINIIENNIEDLSQKVNSHFAKIMSNKARVEQKEQEKREIQDNLEKLEKEKEKIKDSFKNFLEEREKLIDDEKKLEKEIRNLSETIDIKSEELEKLENKIKEKKESIENEKIKLIECENELKTLINEQDMKKAMKKEIESRQINILNEIDTTKQKITKIEEEYRKNETKIMENKKQMELKEIELKQIQDEYNKLIHYIENLEKEIKDYRNKFDSIKEEQYELKLEIGNIEHDIRTIYSTLKDEYNVEVNEEEISKYFLEEEVYKELKFQIDKGKEKIEKLGVINLVAIEEYEEAKNRLEMLEKQYNDLAEARENLKKIIKKANDTSKELFEKSFKEIREKFKSVFTQMMNGGEADLILVDKENILESGIEIIARPPGKRQQTITLLSGGEKTVTAISLLFAIFLIKASPFCIMDEVDAALDDFNVTRFVNLVKIFKEKTQFIIVSHNKLTIETADILYGVSMSEDGVSKIISAKLDKKEDMIKKN